MTENVTTGEEVLALPLRKRGRWNGGDNTIGAYLIELFAQFWAGDADPKYGMVGDSDWQYDLYEPLRDAGLIPAWEYGYGLGHRQDGSEHVEDQERADVLIQSAIRALATPHDREAGPSRCGLILCPCGKGEVIEHRDDCDQDGYECVRMESDKKRRQEG